MRTLVALMLAVVLAMPQAEAQEAAARKYALLIGVQQYDRNQLRNLPFAEGDVTELAKLLEQSGFRRVVLLTQTEGAKQFKRLPTSANIRTSLAGILEDRTKDDLVLVGFAGHGVQFKNEDENYFCPMDAVLTKRESLVSLKEVYTALEKSAAGTKLLMVDACRNDPLAGSARAGADVELGSSTRPQMPDPPGGVAAFFSCSRGQKAFEDDTLKHGVFFHHVILGMKGAAKLSRREEVTWDSLVAYTKAEVPDTVKDLFGDDVRQVPEHRGRLNGSVALVSFGKANIPSVNSPSSSTTPVQASLEGKQAGEVREDNASKIKLCWCPPGAFTMGSSPNEVNREDKEDQATVTMSKGFWLGKYEVTQGEWQQVMGTTLAQERAKADVDFDVTGVGPRQPMYYTSYVSANEFCAKLTEGERRAGRLPEGWVYRLPTEAEWEYACRAGTSTAMGFGQGLNGTQANFDAAQPYPSGPPGVTSKGTKLVGSFKPNPWGLHDMHGNVSEWCIDIFINKLPGGRDPVVLKDFQNTLRIIRGGAWHVAGAFCRSASRTWGNPGSASAYTGLRVALGHELPTQQK